MEHIDSWKSESVFRKQLELNIRELNGKYPEHWYSFIKLLSTFNTKINLLDIGCGVGTYSELCKRHLKNISYTGIDYSEDAINIAKKYWNNGSTFLTKDLYQLDEEFISNFNFLHMGALLDVLPNADEVLDFILNFSVKNIILSRVDVKEKTECYTYTAYDEITTYKYIHSKDVLLKTISNNNYKIIGIDSNNILLEKII